MGRIIGGYQGGAGVAYQTLWATSSSLFIYLLLKPYSLVPFLAKGIASFLRWKQ